MKPIEKLEVGDTLGRLTIGDYVRNVRNHPLFPETKIGYLRRGRLRECVCSCGQMKLIAEAFLLSGSIKSCGCLKAETWENSKRLVNSIKTLKAERKVLCAYIRSEQTRLKYLQTKPIEIRDEPSIKICAEVLRRAFARKRELTRLISRK